MPQTGDKGRQERSLLTAPPLLPFKQEKVFKVQAPVALETLSGFHLIGNGADVALPVTLKIGLSIHSADPRPCTFAKNSLFLGPSNSQKKILCQVPKTGRPFSMMSVSDGPRRLAFTWASELPSIWEKPQSRGTRRLSAITMSSATDGSAPSLTVIDAVVWGQ